MESEIINTDMLDAIIVGRVEPHIYAFTTQTVPNYLKIGDTYRPLNVRINEWKSIYPNLKHIYSHTARIDNNTIFRDLSVHKFLENVKSRHRLMPEDLPSIPYYSCEFFKDATTDDIDEAISDILQVQAITMDDIPFIHRTIFQKSSLIYAVIVTHLVRTNNRLSIISCQLINLVGKIC